MIVKKIWFAFLIIVLIGIFTRISRMVEKDSKTMEEENLWVILSAISQKYSKLAYIPHQIITLSVWWMNLVD